MIAGDDQERRLMMFSGKHEDWSYWEERFMIRASRMGFRDVLKGIIKMPSANEDQDLQMEAQRQWREIQEKNKLAFEELVTMMDTSQENGREVLRLIKSSQTSEFT